MNYIFLKQLVFQLQIPQGTLRDNFRCSTAKAFLQPVRHRKNLHIGLNSHVHRVLIDDQRRAYGVVVERKQQIQHIRATKEVILSAGAIGSPQLMMLSGVGDATHLSEMKIPVVRDLPGVGKNLQDHVIARGLIYLIDQPISYVETRFINLPSILKYFFKRGGPLGSLSGMEGLAWVNTKYANPE